MQNPEFDQITQGLTSKSAKMRALAQHGIATKDIAEYIGVRYQHARNVLVQSGLHRLSSGTSPALAPKGDASGGPALPATSEARTSSAWVSVDSAGRLQLPGSMLAAAGIGPGRVHVRAAGDVIEIRSKRAALKHAQDIVREFVPPGVSLVDELIEERRREASQEGSGDEADR